MARSNFLTSLPLDTYADSMRINLAHFNQMNKQNAPLSGDCDNVWDQNDRDELARTIQQAEKMIKSQLGFDLIPTFYENANVRLVRNIRTDWWNGEYLAPTKRVTDYGTRTLTPLFYGAPVTYMDLDGDPRGVLETAVIGDWLYDMLPACSEECSLKVFFRAADGAKDTAHPAWEIRPITVDIDSDFAIIQAPSAMFIKPELTLLTEDACFKSDDEEAWIWAYDEDNLVGYVDIFCETVDTSDQGEVYWLDGCGSCSDTSAELCIYPVDDWIGRFVLEPKTGECISPCPPRKMLINYRSGYPLDDRCQMDTNLQRAVIKLTNALLPQTPCGCTYPYNIWTHDRQPIDTLTAESANMPWDLYAQGALEAWRIVRAYTSADV